MTRNDTIRSGARAIAAAGLLSALAFAGSVLAAEATAPPAQATSSAPTAPAASAASKAVTDRDEMRITDLRNKLKITPEQDALWNDVAKILRSNDEKMDVLTKERHDKAATMTAIDDLRSYEAISAAHAAATKALLPAFEKLYDSMSAAQKANADNVFRHTGQKTHTAHKKAM
jgi:hypothetical protein